MMWTSDAETAERFLGTVVGVEEVAYAVILLRIYDDGFLTSAGFFKKLLLPDEPVSVEDTSDTVLYHAVAATELPTDFQNYWAILANEKEVLIEADRYIMFTMLTEVDPSATGVFRHLATVDVEAAEELLQSDRPEIKSPDFEYPVFIDHEGHGYSWLLLVKCIK